MKQLLLKEWREHFKFAVLGLGIFGLLLVITVHSGTGQLNSVAFGGGMIMAEWLQPLVCGQILVVSAVCCAIFGSALGWLQIQAERHPDLRAFLLHRPVEPATILGSKLLSGVGLYALAAGVPLLGLVVYALLPGNVAAPFEPAMLLPVTAAFLLGLVFYGAGLLTGLRSARWFASRAFGLGPAILAAIGAFEVPEFWQALAIIVAAGALVGLAVYASFLTGGFYRDQSRPGKVALSFVCAITGLILCGLAGALLDNLLTGPGSYHYSRYDMNLKGEVFQITAGSPGPAIILDLQGHPALDGRTGKPITLTDFNKQRPIDLSATVNFDHSRQRQIPEWARYNNAMRYFIPWQMAGKTLWYLNRQGQLMGYDAATRRQVATLIAPDAPGIGFNWPENYYNDNYFRPANENPRQLVATDKTLYQVDVENQTINPLLTTTNAEGIGGFTENADMHEVLVVTRDFVREFNFESGTRVQVPSESGPAGDSEITFSWLTPTNHFALRFAPEKPHRERVEWVAGDGAVLHQQELPPLPEPQWQQDQVGTYIAVIFPPAARGVASAVMYGYGHFHGFNRWDAFSFIPAAVCALLGWGRGRRYHFAPGEQLAWAAFHMLVGIPGLIAFFCVQEWPAKESCPQCKKLRMVDREHCEYCGGDFAPPECNGTEIFEPAVVSAGN